MSQLLEQGKATRNVQWWTAKYKNLFFQACLYLNSDFIKAINMPAVNSLSNGREAKPPKRNSEGRRLKKPRQLCLRLQRDAESYPVVIIIKYLLSCSLKSRSYFSFCKHNLIYTKSTVVMKSRCHKKPAFLPDVFLLGTLLQGNSFSSSDVLTMSGVLVGTCWQIHDDNSIQSHTFEF